MVYINFNVVPQVSPIAVAGNVGGLISLSRASDLLFLFKLLRSIKDNDNCEYYSGRKMVDITLTSNDPKKRAKTERERETMNRWSGKGEGLNTFERGTVALFCFWQGGHSIVQSNVPYRQR